MAEEARRKHTSRVYKVGEAGREDNVSYVVL